MRLFVLTIVFTIATSAFCATGYAQPAAQPPNIVLFVVDDMGWQDASVPFWTERAVNNDLYRTPNLERLAAQGMKFTRAYAAALCTPTRVSIMTGQNMARHRVTNWTMRLNVDQGQNHPRLVPPQWNINGLQPTGSNIARTIEAPTLPHLLKETGYRTIHIGKAHLGAETTPGADPLNLGFDRNIGGHEAGGPGSYLGTNNFSAAFRSADRIWDVPHLKRYHGKDTFLTEALTLEAIELVGEAVRDEKPFFLHMSHYAPHVPLEPDDRFITRYRELGLPEPQARYAALIEGMDKSLGDIMAHLDTLEIADKTVVVFISDNGGMAGQGGLPENQNTPLRSGKESFFEGGIRIPMIVRWPGKTEAGAVNQTPVIVEDLYPTLLSIAGAVIPERERNRIDGKDLGGIFRGNGDLPANRALVFHLPQQLYSGIGHEPFSVIVQGDWKLIYTFNHSQFQLYNLREDIGESNNLAADKPKLVSQMALTLARILRDRSAQCPVVKNGQQIRLRIDGLAYHNGKLTLHANETVTIHAGEEMPLIVPAVQAGS